MGDIVNSRMAIYNTAGAFRYKNDEQLKKSLWLYKMINIPLFNRMGIFFMQHLNFLGGPVKRLIKNTVFQQFCAGEDLDESLKVVNDLGKTKVKSILDYSVEGGGNDNVYDKVQKEILKIISIAKENSDIPYTCIKLTGLVNPSLLEKKSLSQELTLDELATYSRFTVRLNAIFNMAYTCNVPIFIDAEESWVQIEIDRIAEEAMRTYNKNKAIVLTTIQLYRNDKLDYLRRLIADSIKRNYFLGVKLVRGAYMEKERSFAHLHNLSCVIHSSKESTDYDFNKGLELCLDHIDRIFLCIGTHNEVSTLTAIEMMEKRQIPSNHSHIYFSQLYGMSDHISFNLAERGYNVSKYLPYGPIRSVIPYLVRRAKENTSIAGQMSRELELLKTEYQRRKRLALPSQT